MAFHAFKMATIDGGTRAFDDFVGRHVLIVNVASK